MRVTAVKGGYGQYSLYKAKAFPPRLLRIPSASHPARCKYTQESTQTQREQTFDCPLCHSRGTSARALSPATRRASSSGTSGCRGRGTIRPVRGSAWQFTKCSLPRREKSITFTFSLPIAGPGSTGAKLHSEFAAISQQRLTC